MTAKEFLMQACHLEQQINEKMEEIRRLEALATRANVILGGNGQSGGSRDLHSRERLVCGIMDMQKDVDNQVERLLTVRQDIMNAINELPDPRQKLVLEKRYLYNKRWMQIAEEMQYSLNPIYELHRKALLNLKFKKF